MSEPECGRGHGDRSSEPSPRYIEEHLTEEIDVAGLASGLKALRDTEPAGLLQVSADVDPDYTEGSELTYLHGVAVNDGTPVPEDLKAIEVPAGTWAVFRTAGPYPAALQSTWAPTASDWFPSNRGG